MEHFLLDEQSTTSTEDAMTTVSHSMCPTAWQTANVDYLGYVRPCCHVSTPNGFGNLNDQSFSEIWNGEPWRRLREAWVSGDTTGTPCEGCKVLKTQGIPPHIEVTPKLGTESTAAVLNQSLNFKEFQSGTTYLKSMPVNIQYFPSTICNIDCEFCYQFDVKGRKLGPPGAQLISDLTPTLMRIEWIGGEPMVQKDFRSWLSSFDSEINPNINIGMVSNGTILDEAAINLFLKYPSFVFISLDAVEKVLYEKIRRGANWEKTLENIHKYLKVRDENKNFSITALCLLQKENLSALPDFLAFCIEHRIPANINPLENFPPSMRINMFDCLDEELPSNFLSIMQKSVELGRELDLLTGGMTEKCIQYCLSAIFRGIQNSINSRPFYGKAGLEYAGYIVFARTADFTIHGYTHVKPDGSIKINVPDGVDKSDLRLWVYDNNLGTKAILELHWIDSSQEFRAAK